MHPENSARSAGHSDNAAGLLDRHPSGLLLARDLTQLGEDSRTARRAGATLAKVRPGAYVDAGAWAKARQLERHRLVVLATVAGMRTSRSCPTSLRLPSSASRWSVRCQTGFR